MSFFGKNIVYIRSKFICLLPSKKKGGPPIRDRRRVEPPKDYEATKGRLRRMALRAIVEATALSRLPTEGCPLRHHPLQ